MIEEPEQECAHLAKQLITACPPDAKALIEKCYLVIYREQLIHKDFLLATLFIPDALVNEVEKHYLILTELAQKMGIGLSHVSISEWFSFAKKKLLEEWRITRPRHCLTLLSLLEGGINLKHDKH